MNKSIRINNEKHSRLVQDRLHELGYEWMNPKVYQEVQDGRFIQIDSGGMYMQDTPTYDLVNLKDLKEM